MNDPVIRVATDSVHVINTQNVDALAASMTPDHKFTDSLGNVVTGRDTMRSGWDYSITVEEMHGDGDVLLGTAQGTYKGKEGLSAENLWQTPATARARSEDGLVAEWRVYADNEPSRALMR